MIAFTTTLYTVNKQLILHLPEAASKQLPSRGQTMVSGSINGIDFSNPLEPDGQFGHWLAIDTAMQKNRNIHDGDTVNVELEPSKDWPEPAIPDDLAAAVKADKALYGLWQSFTPMARWEWIRWVRSTSSTETRARRVEVACSKMRSGKRRPCCWNRNICSDPAVSKSGVLLAAT